jgi:mono/diheme cytochrome c family protein
MHFQYRDCVFVTVITLWASSLVQADDQGGALFESKIRPLLVKHCFECHSNDSGQNQGGLLLDSKPGWAVGGDSGPAIVSGKPEKSLLLRAIRYDDENLQMPPKSKLDAAEIQAFATWIQMGAPDPRAEATPVKSSSLKRTIDVASERQGWAYRPIQTVEVPRVQSTDWPWSPIDNFILFKIEENKLTPASDANSDSLIRRLFYDLTGLPPTAEDVSAFKQGEGINGRAKAINQIVETLLASSAFGEKFGRSWLDLVRYADSNGGDRNYTYYQAWRYRNYVIQALNSDKSYYDFVREQIAGDLLPSQTEQQRHDQLVGSTFLSLGPKMLTERDKEKLQLDTVDEQIDTLGKAFLGMTFGCARCHDHKFDPITQRDYYAMAGIFRGTEVVMGTRNGCVNVASWVEQSLPGEDCDAMKQRIARLELTMRLKVERDFMKKAGGKSTLDELPLAGVIYDEEDAELLGAWTISQLSPKRFGDSYARNDKKQGETIKAVFRGSLPETGLYEVRVAYPAKAGLDKHVPITIEATDGIHEVLLDQTKTPIIGGLFEPIGRFRFEKGLAAKVVIHTLGTKDHVIVDAVQFISVIDLEREAIAIAMMEGRADGDPLLRMDSGDLGKEINKQIDELKVAEVVMAPRDFSDATDIPLRVRGEVSQHGPIIPRGFPAVLYDGPPPQIEPRTSGRLQLANWIVSEENALLDRVIVNRIWLQLFGRGIVATVDNFGAQGEKPSHPELLEYLARRFRQSGGSIKTLVRELVISRVYQLAAEGSSQRTVHDPENRLFSKRNYRRLAAEELRDTALFIAGDLERTTVGATAINLGEDLDKPMKLDKAVYRSVYLPIARNNLLPELEIFDAANPELATGERILTTVPTQSLYLLNGSFLAQQAKKLASEAYSQPEAITWLYQRILSRNPTNSALERASKFIETSYRDRAEALGELAHVLMASTEFIFIE